MSTPPSPAIRHTTTAAVAGVGLIAAVVSYSHMQQLGFHHGEDWRSYLIPLSIDGLMAAASMVLLTRRRSGLPASALAWVALVLGGIASLAANMADAQPNATAILYAGWAPVGFLLAFELLLQQRRAEIVDSPAVAEAEVGLAVPHQPAEPVLPTQFVAPPVATSEPVVVRQEPVVVATPAPPKAATKPRQKAVATPEQRRAWVRQERDKGRVVTGADVHKQFPDSPRDGARIVRQVEAETRPALRAVAAGSR
jgi:hypothetical protein